MRPNWVLKQPDKLSYVNVEGLSLDELKQSKKIRSGVKITCNYYRFEQVNKILRQKIDIIPFRMRSSEKTKNELNQLREGSKVMFIFDEQDQSTLGLILEDYKKAFSDRNLAFTARSGKEFPRLVKAKGSTTFLLSKQDQRFDPTKASKRTGSNTFGYGI